MGGRLAALFRRVDKLVLQHKGAGGDSEQDGGKHAERQRKMLEKFDADKDGQLNETERAKAREARKTRPATGA